MKQYKLIIFDLDGTLLNSIEGIGTAMNVVLDKYGYPQHSIDKYYYFVGNGLKKLAERALPAEVVDKEGVEEYYRELKISYDIHYSVGLKLYPGIAELLDHLSDRGYLLAINSNKIDHMVRKIARDYYGKWKWQAVIGDREGIPIKPNRIGVDEIIAGAGVKRTEVLYVGDSEVDMQTAHNAEVDVAFVTWGFRKLEDIAGQKVNYIIDSPQQLAELLI
ncbi:HAD family hydrolase [Clostridiales bacterium COT073_COT-073]|nr:HAD family hydrolase [Clostridiales bacterium COT073_COT-073]